MFLAPQARIPLLIIIIRYHDVVSLGEMLERRGVEGILVLKVVDYLLRNLKGIKSLLLEKCLYLINQFK